MICNGDVDYGEHADPIVLKYHRSVPNPISIGSLLSVLVHMFLWSFKPESLKKHVFFSVALCALK